MAVDVSITAEVTTSTDGKDIAVLGSGNVWLKGMASGERTYKVLITYDGTIYSATLTK